MLKKLQKPAFVIALVAVIATVAAAVSVVVALSRPAPIPEISLWVSSGTYARVLPVADCTDLELRDCPVAPGSRLPERVLVDPSARVLISVPGEVAKGWLLNLEWVGDDGQTIRVENDQRPFFPKDGEGEPTYSTWIEPNPHGLRLRSIAVTTPTNQFTSDGHDNLVARQFWLICTTDEPCDQPLTSGN